MNVSTHRASAEVAPAERGAAPEGGSAGASPGAEGAFEAVLAPLLHALTGTVAPAPDPNAAPASAQEGAALAPADGAIRGEAASARFELQGLQRSGVSAPAHGPQPAVAAPSTAPEATEASHPAPPGPEHSERSAIRAQVQASESTPQSARPFASPAEAAGVDGSASGASANQPVATPTRTGVPERSAPVPSQQADGVEGEEVPVSGPSAPRAPERPEPSGPRPETLRSAPAQATAASAEPLPASLQSLETPAILPPDQRRSVPGQAEVPQLADEPATAGMAAGSREASSEAVEAEAARPSASSAETDQPDLGTATGDGREQASDRQRGRPARPDAAPQTVRAAADAPADVAVNAAQSGTNVPASGKDVRPERNAPDAAPRIADGIEAVLVQGIEPAASVVAGVPEPGLEGDPEGVLPVPAPASAPADAPTAARAETARAPLSAALMERWQADLQGLVSDLRTEAGGWQRLRLRLDDDSGTVTLRARREDDHVAVSVAFSDPVLRQVAHASAERLHAALETHLGQHVAFSFEGGGTNQHTSPEDRRAASSASPSTPASESERNASLPRRAAPGKREWIG